MTDHLGKTFRESCSGHGKYIGSRCRCDKKYYGPKCQYVDECISDDDCGQQGKCIDLQGTSLPRRQCYCNFGWNGPHCNKSKTFQFNVKYILQYIGCEKQLKQLIINRNCHKTPYKKRDK